MIETWADCVICDYSQNYKGKEVCNKVDFVELPKKGKPTCVLPNRSRQWPQMSYKTVGNKLDPS